MNFSNFLFVLLFRTIKSQPKILPKSPVPPLISPPREYKTYSPDHFEPAHEHLDEVREERFYLSQVKKEKKIQINFNLKYFGNSPTVLFNK